MKFQGEHGNSRTEVRPMRRAENLLGVTSLPRWELSPSIVYLAAKPAKPAFIAVTLHKSAVSLFLKRSASLNPEQGLNFWMEILTCQTHAHEVNSDLAEN